MKRLSTLLILIVCCLTLSIPAHAQSSAEQISGKAQVLSDGSCTVTLHVTLRYDEAVASPVFPVPSNAQNVLLNGDPVTVFAAANSRMVSLKSLTGGRAGTYSFTLGYRLSAVVSSGSGDGLLLELPLLSGFPYPIEAFQATLTLPGPIEGSPVFSSGYHQENIKRYLNVTVEGSTLTVATTQPLKDHETLHLTLRVSEDMFPSTARTFRMLSLMDLAIVLTVLVALGYYLLTLRPRLPRRVPRPDAPDGITAGDTPLWLTGSPMDLSLLVVSWAQMGYLRIEVGASGRVRLHKRMDMGNERSAFENRCFKDLFGRRRILDGTGRHYAELCRSVARSAPQAKKIYAPRSGKPVVFRGLCAVAGMLSGIALAGAISPQSTLLQITLAAVCGVMSVLIQSVGKSLLLRHRRPMLIGAVCAAGWLIIGCIAADLIVPGLMIGFQFLAGILAAFGGKRTELGRQALIQLLSLRKFMGSVSKQELHRLLKANPGYFHERAPYALALGMDRRFARRFERLRLPECSYLTSPNKQQMTASEWAQLLRTTVRALDAKAQRLFFDKLTGK